MFNDHGEIMRVLCLITWLAVASGCSSYVVHCDSHLRPINVVPHARAAEAEGSHPVAHSASPVNP